MEGGKGVGGRGGRGGGVGQWPGGTIVVIWAFGDAPSASPVLADNHNNNSNNNNSNNSNNN